MPISVAKAKRESQAEWLRAIVEAMANAVVVTDEKGRVVLVNGALEQIFARRGAIGRRAKDVIDDDRLRGALRTARKLGRSSEVELERTRGGKRSSYRAHVTPLPNRAGAVAVLHDITSLAEADQLRRDFVGNASHELRTPLMAIRGFAETLRDGALDDREAARRFLATILSQTARLERLAEDLLSLARAESSDDAFELAPLDVRGVASDVVASFGPAARAKRITLDLQIPLRPVRARANARALEQVLGNLVDNAIKYSPARRRVAVTVGASTRGRVRIEVRDSGPGIAPEHQERVFERFYRVDEGRSREMGGTGLGLAIVRHLVARLGGTIALESEPGEGAAFLIELRRATTRRRRPAARPRSGRRR